MNSKKLITPRKLQGFWELMPKEEMAFSSLLNSIENVFKQSSFVPLDTPVLEYSETLLAKSGGDTDKEVYRFTKGSTDMCMRYDLTVPLARFVAMHKDELSFPFKRYQIGKVYRGERPQKGRFREFYQCDADIIGNETLSIVAHAECIALFEKCFEALNLEVEIDVSNRKIIAGYIQSIDKENVSNEIFIILDKIAKLPIEEIYAQLKNLGLTQLETEKITKLASLSGSFEKVVSFLKDFSNNELYLEGVKELSELNEYLIAFGVKTVSYNLSIIRGHNYYTGTVFEGFLKDKRNLGAVGGGGSFDNLCNYFTEKKMPGVGMSVGITRLFDILVKENYFNRDDFNEVDCAVISFDETLKDALSLTVKLRENSIRADCLYENKTFKSKMKEANRRKIKFVLIVGEDEVKSKLYTLKNMETSNQEKLSFEDVVKKIKDDRM